MRKNVKWMVAGSSVLAVATVVAAASMLTVGAGAATGGGPATALHVSAADSTGNAASADQAAITYADAQYPGSGVATVLSTTSDTIGGVAIYDVTLSAPNGSKYEVQVQQSNDVVLSADPIAPPVTTPPVTTPPVTTPPVLTPVTNAPIVVGDPDVTESEQSNATGTEDSASASSDASNGATTSSTVTTSPSADGSGDSQGASPSGSSGSSDATSSTTSGDN